MSAVLDPVKLVITNYPEGETEEMEAINNPENEADGTHTITRGVLVFPFAFVFSLVAGGSTLGNILASSIPLKGVDMGNAILAMHSCRETGSVIDHEYCVKAFTKFYQL